MKDHTAKEGSAKDGGRSTDMKEMRERYERAVDAEKENREKALDDLKFIMVPGHQWDSAQRKARRGRPCYEFPILRSHWRQVVNDQKKARTGIKVRAVRDATAEDAELRQGLIRNIESTSNADWAYDSAFELLAACGFGAWRVVTRYSDDDAWDQDLAIEQINDPLTSVWLDPDSRKPDGSDATFGFVEETMSTAAFRKKYPDAQVVSFDSGSSQGMASWFTDDSVRVAEYWRLEPVTKTILLLSDGRSVDRAEVEPVLDEMAAQGITVERERTCKSHKVVMSIVSGADELEGPFDTVFHRIPIITCHANLHVVEGKRTWCGMVRFSRDPQKLVNYNLTTGQEVLGKQHKATPVLTPKMLDGKGVKAMWDKSNAIDVPYLPFTPDPLMPGGLPVYLSPPPVHAAFAQFGQMAIDMLKASDGIYDASVGARSNETSGKAIMARQQEGDTATFDYQDALAKSKLSTGEVLDRALSKVYDTPRQVRIIGKDGSEDFVQLYEDVRDNQTGQSVRVNDLSKGKYDITMSEGGNYDTQRMEFVDTLERLGSGNPIIAQSVPDLIIGSLDFPKADEAAERIKLMLPQPIQQQLASKDQSPAALQAQQQVQQLQQQADQHIQQLNDQIQQLQVKAQSKDDALAREQNAAEDRELAWFNAITQRIGVLQKDAHASAQLDMAAASEAMAHMGGEADRQHEAHLKAMDQQHQVGMSQMQTEMAPNENPNAGDRAA